MGIIQTLSEHITNQITAGEVIERPAAVVKELLENSLDAQATHIRIELKNAGKTYISVEDNGTGMSPEDAIVALNPHTTSKIGSMQDLERIQTFGFRGEALASIASVSELTLKTRLVNNAHGIQIVVDAGTIKHQMECGMPQGTHIEVRHLFHNVSARSRFLKSDSYESAIIHQLTRVYAIAAPKVAFSLRDSGKLLFQSPTCSSLKERILEIWGDALADVLLPVDSTTDDFQLQGWMGRPGFYRHSRKDIIWIINNRPVDCAFLNAILYETYAQLLPKNKYPIGFLLFHLPAEFLDVNVSPTKREVRFREEKTIREFITRALRKALHSSPAVGIEESINLLNDDEITFVGPISQPNNSVFQSAQLEPLQLNSPAIFKDKPSSLDFDLAQLTDPMMGPSVRSSPPNSLDATAPWTVVCMLRKPYALLRSASGLVLFHVKAACERIYYEKILHDLKHQSFHRQILGVANYVTLDPIQAHAMQDRLEEWERYGFEIEPFGNQKFKIQAIPTWIDQTDATLAVQHLADLFFNKQLADNHFETHLALILTNFKAAQAEKHISESTLLPLAMDLLNCSAPFICPKGKPTFFEITFSEISKRFMR
jgi:DNA mismatch repair protein MutL